MYRARYNYSGAKVKVKLTMKGKGCSIVMCSVVNSSKKKKEDGLTSLNIIKHLKQAPLYDRY